LINTISTKDFTDLFNDVDILFSRKKLWQLIENVHIQNLIGDQFGTPELFWDLRKPPSSIDAIYSDTFVRVTPASGEIFTGKRFRSDMLMSNYQSQ
jgi:hypothetical protein